MSNQWMSTTQGRVMNVAPAEPIKTPTGIIVTRSVETKDGWVGQIIVDKTIVWESEPLEDGDDQKYESTGQRQAVKAANERVIGALTRLFA